MENHRIRILLFDIDCTLLDPAREARVCVQEALEEVYGTAGPIDAYSMAGKTDWQIFTDLLSSAGLDADTISARISDAFTAYARQVTLKAPRFNMRILPGVGELLTRLNESSHFSLGLVTGNSRDAVPPKLSAVGIHPKQFHFGAFGDDHLDRNELPALALSRASQFLGMPISPAQSLVIGDTAYDIACARHSGIKVLSVATGGSDLETLARLQPDYLLPDLSDTQQVMKILSTF